MRWEPTNPRPRSTRLNAGETERPGPRLIPYLLIGCALFIVANLAARVRTVEPVFLWVFTQALLLEKLWSGSFLLVEAIWLTFYMGAAIVAWVLVERRAADRSRVWRRAAISWLAILAAYGLVALVLVQTGVLAE